MGITRYAFWRDQRGTPYRKDTTTHAPKVLIKECFADATIAASSISWPWGGGHEHLDVIVSSIAIIHNKEELIAENGSRMIRSGLISAISTALNGGKTSLPPSEILKSIDQIASKHYRTAPASYAYITSLSVAGWPSAAPIAIDKCVINPLHDRSTHPINPELISRLKHGPLGTHLAGSPYQLLRIDCDGRAFEVAAFEAREALHLLRGIWTLLWTHGQTTLSFSNANPSSLGVFHVGAFSTIHDHSGNQIDKMHWYDPSYPPLYKLPPSKLHLKKWASIEEQRVKCMALLISHPFRKYVEGLVRRYALALDGHDDESCFLRLWSLLEAVTATEDAEFDKTIARATWGFGDKLVVSEFLQHCRMRRNRYVHGSTSTGYAIDVNQFLKELVERHLLQLIRNDFRVNSMAEYGSYLSMPDTPKALEKSIVKQRQAFTLLGGHVANLLDGDGI